MKFGKLLLTVLLTLCLLSSVPVFAVDATAPTPDTRMENSDVTPYAEETEWLIVERDGRIYKRLWSNTRGIWLTDWIDCGPIPS